MEGQLVKSLEKLQIFRHNIILEWKACNHILSKDELFDGNIYFDHSQLAPTMHGHFQGSPGKPQKELDQRVLNSL